MLIYPRIYRLAAYDDFMLKLYDIYRRVRDDPQIPNADYCLNIIRCDYLLNEDPATGHATAKQVEYNTIASSFSSLSTLVSQLHR